MLEGFLLSFFKYRGQTFESSRLKRLVHRHGYANGSQTQPSTIRSRFSKIGAVSWEFTRFFPKNVLFANIAINNTIAFFQNLLFAPSASNASNAAIGTPTGLKHSHQQYDRVLPKLALPAGNSLAFFQKTYFLQT